MICYRVQLFQLLRETVIEKITGYLFSVSFYFLLSFYVCLSLHKVSNCFLLYTRYNYIL